MQGEYRGDFTRDTFHRANHFCRVLMQQGRVQLDADWNEQTAILLHFLRSLAGDLIGRHGGPANNLGFNVQSPPGQDDFAFGAGHYYVDGILCEFDALAVPGTWTSPTQITLTQFTANAVGFGFQAGQWVELLDATKGTSLGFGQIDSLDASGLLVLKNNAVTGSTGGEVFVRRTSSYLTQNNYPNPSALKLPCLVYLDVWERHLTSAQQDQIREVALNGPDTASRAQVVWQVKMETNTPQGLQFPPSTTTVSPISDQQWPAWTSLWQPPNRGRLAVQVQPLTTSANPCVISPQSAYRGPENQLYRVEIHGGGQLSAPNTPTFKWSRENGSVVFPILKLGPGTSSTPTMVWLANLGRDSRLSLRVNDWVEVVDDASDLSGAVGALLQVQAVDPVAVTVTLAGTTSLTVGTPPTTHPLLRRWDQQQGDASQGGLTLQNGAALVVEGTGAGNWLGLEDGIQIQFQPGATYRPGDYWLIPARVATGDIEWPRQSDGKGGQTPLALPPHGVEHHYAPLAYLLGAKPVDLRLKYDALAQ